MHTLFNLIEKSEDLMRHLKEFTSTIIIWESDLFLTCVERKKRSLSWCSLQFRNRGPFSPQVGVKRVNFISQDSLFFTLHSRSLDYFFCCPQIIHFDFLSSFQFRFWWTFRTRKLVETFFQWFVHFCQSWINYLIPKKRFYHPYSFLITFET